MRGRVILECDRKAYGAGSNTQPDIKRAWRAS